MEFHAKFRKDADNPLSDLIGSLICLIMMRPAIAYALNIVSQLVGQSHKQHLTVVHCILRYIRGTLHQGLFYVSNYMPHLCAYADVD